MSDSSSYVVPLSRGGVLVRTRSGPIQFGVPPETIKDTMLLDTGVPNVFVLARHLFDFERGVTLAEIEFPIYFNFFIKQRKVVVICEPYQRVRLTSVIRETLFPPVPKNIHLEYPDGLAHPVMPDMARELAFFQRHPREPDRDFTLDDVLEFREIPPDGVVRLGELEVILDREEGAFRVLEAGHRIAVIPWDLGIPEPSPEIKHVAPYHPPMFGITALGTGSGFDPMSATSGFVLWVHRRGIMVDPPVDSTLSLREERIHPKLIQEIILTHCHADHDSGVLQKVLEDGIVRVYTTPTIMEAFLRKAELLTGLEREKLERMIQFNPVPIGVPFTILGARFVFRYNLHSVPTIGFKMSLEGHSIAYSSDIMNVPQLLLAIHEQGVISDARYQDLVDFPWDADIVVHEAGIPPLHTPPSELTKLPDDVKRRLYLVHTVESRVMPYPGLRMMGHGIAHTLTIDIPETQHSEYFQRLKVLSGVDYLRDLTVGKTADLLQMAEKRSLTAGEYLIHKGDRGQELYIILHGEVSILRENREYKVYGSGDIVGDMALVNDEPRFADVITRFGVTYLAIKKSDFLPLIEKTGFLEYLKHLAQMRKQDSWPLLERSSIVSFMNVHQLTQLQAVMSPCTFAPGDILTGAEGEEPYGYLLVNGHVDVHHRGVKLGTLGRGAFIGELGCSLDEESPGSYLVTASSPVESYRVKGRALEWFLENNPGVRLRLVQRCRYEDQLQNGSWGSSYHLSKGQRRGPGRDVALRRKRR